MKTRRQFCEECNRVINTKDVRDPFRNIGVRFVYLFGTCRGCGTTVSIAKKQRREKMSEKKTLSEYVLSAADLEAALIESGGEVTEEIEKLLAEWEENFSEKVDGYAFIMEHFKDAADKWKSKASLMLDAAKACKSAEERLKERLKWGMREMDVDEVAGETYRFKLSKLKPKVIIDDSEVVPDEFKEKVIEFKIVKDKISDALKAGKNIPGVHSEESISIRRYLVKKEK